MSDNTMDEHVADKPAGGRLLSLTLLVLLNLIFAVVALAWLRLIPYNNAPDENTHFAYSVEFILKNHRLPVWGQDDLEQFRHTLSSHNHMPMLHYVFAAATATAARAAVGWEEWRGARLASLVWGLILVNALFLALRRLRAAPALAALVTAGVVLIPQVVFVGSYLNGDAHSLAIAALVAYAFIRLWQAPSRGNHVVFGVACGLLLCAKYNYWIYALPLGIGLIALARVRALSLRQMAAGWLTIGGVALLVGGFWFARNAVLFGTPMPMLLDPARLAAAGIVPELKPIDMGLSAGSLTWLFRQGFVETTFMSFFALFGYLDVALSPAIYTVLGFAVIMILALFVADAVTRRDTAVRWVLLAALVFAELCVAMHVWGCLRVAYQPQGRYEYPLLVPLALVAGWSIARHPRLWRYAVAWVAVMVWLLAASSLLLAQTYTQPLHVAVYWAGADRTFSPARAAQAPLVQEQKNLMVAANLPVGADVTYLRVDFPEACRASWREVGVVVIGSADARALDWAALPESAVECHDVYRHRPDWFIVTGPDPYVAVRLPAGPTRIDGVVVSARVEHWRPATP